MWPSLSLVREEKSPIGGMVDVPRYQGKSSAKMTRIKNSMDRVEITSTARTKDIHHRFSSLSSAFLAVVGVRYLHRTSAICLSGGSLGKPHPEAAGEAVD